MDKIFLKPAVKEITIRGNSREGHTDVFAYDYYDDDDKRKLGGLYIIGNVKQEGVVADAENAPDIAYVTNLVASLAKREYYSRLDASPRDAFSATLKKINDVVEEFFSARGGSAYGGKGLKINIGIFAVAGEQILISKLGKFKIVLGRESRAVDILDNIDLFSKEQVEEKEFSNIISGKIMAGDKLFAFYPNRMLTAREKTIKADLLKLGGDQFIEKVDSVKETRPDFACGALYLSLNNHKEPAAAKSDLAKAKSDLAAVKKPRTAAPEKAGAFANLAKADLKGAPVAKKKEDSVADNKPEIAEPAPEVPRIISSEFSLGRKVNPLLASMLAPMKMVRDLRRNINLKKKFVILSFVAGILAVGVISVKMFVVIDPEKRQLNTLVDQTQNNLKLVRTKISQNDFIGARQLLVESLSNIYAVGITNDKTQKTANEVYEVLDNIDKAVDVSPSLLETMPEGLSKEKPDANSYGIISPLAFSVYENNLYVLTPDNILKVADINQAGKKEAVSWLKSGTLPPEPSMIAVDGNIYVMNGSGTLAVYYKSEKVSETNAFIVSGAGDVLLTSKNSDKLYLVNKALARIYELDKKSGSLVKTVKVGSSEPFVDAYLYGDSAIIVTTPDGRIWEIK